MIWLSLLCIILLALVFFLAAQNYAMRIGANEICCQLSEKLNCGTNTLISISTGNKIMRRLADSLNEQLAELRKQRNRFVQGDLELKKAVTNISHDLRTPVTAISSYLDLLDTVPKSETAVRYLDIIRNRTEALSQLTEELLQYSVIASPDYERKPVCTSVKQILEDSILACFAALQEKGITPHIQITEKPVMRNLDPSALSRIFSNILNNAVKYSDGDLEIVLTEDGKAVFSNTASRLNAIQTGQLFDRFYTLESAQKSTGLGLSIARVLTEQIGGTITAEYTGGKLQIRLTLPQQAGTHNTKNTRRSVHYGNRDPDIQPETPADHRGYG